MPTISPPPPRLQLAAVPSPLFEIAVEEAGNCLILSLRGELDLNECRTLEGALDDAEEGGADTVVLDLADLSFLDAAGLELLLAECRRWAANGRWLLLTAGRGTVANLFRVTGVEAVLPFMSDDFRSTAAEAQEVKAVA